MKEAYLYEKLKDKKVRCNLCNHRCIIQDGKAGICQVRKNIDGVLYSLVYEKAIASHIDPIEKKPLFHFYPGSRSFSIATIGCNFKCLHCQNADISQFPRERGGIIGEDLSCEKIVELAQKNNCKSISYTYTEPTIFFEYAYDTACLAKQKGIYNNFVTNGYMTKEALDFISPYLNAANVDLKAFSNEFYKKICGAKLEPVLESLKYMKKLGIWLEVTTLIIPTLNDSEKELKEIAEFILKELGSDVPWHVSQFYPTYKLSNLYHTPVATLRKAREIGLEVGLKYVYTGNVVGDEGENTFCYNCHKTLIKRFGYHIREYNISDGKCKFCNAKIDGIGL
jgi:pyruvate formate lyase activating enzyme